LSIHVEEKYSKAALDKANAIRQIDVHTIPVELVFQRFSTSPTLGLESPAVARMTQTFGKNVISPPKTQYWKKVLNYVFGGFNFLMWIAFIVTLVCLRTLFLLCMLVMYPPSALIQLSYKPLGEPHPAIINLGVAILLVRLFVNRMRRPLHHSLASSLVARCHCLRDFLRGR
jgi:sodium/potassium-transporting ATPase subunit alpha